MANTIMYLKDYCGWAASFCYSFKLQLCGLVIGCCWSSFGLDLLQDVATTKGKCQFILHFVGIFDFVRLKICKSDLYILLLNFSLGKTGDLVALKIPL